MRTESCEVSDGVRSDVEEVVIDFGSGENSGANACVGVGVAR